MLQINLYITNNYAIWEQIINQLISVSNISCGEATINNGIITCYDTKTKEKIILKKIDRYRLIVINENRCFKMNEKLYAIKISDSKGQLIEEIGWKNGNRNGYWRTYSEKGVGFVVYDNGKIINKYFKTHKKLREEVLKRPVRL